MSLKSHTLPTNHRGMLIVSLPDNNIEFAKAAIDNGADAVKVHVNLTHASGREFGPLSNYVKEFEEISNLGVPVGLVPGGAGKVLSREDIDTAVDLGIGFINADVAAARPYLTDRPIEFIPSRGGLSDAPSNQWLRYLDKYPGSWIEASSTTVDSHGLPMVIDDLMGLRHIASVTGRRIILPSVRRLVPDDLEYLFQIPNVWAIMIGAFVTGDSIESISKATADFRHGIDEIC